jgi:hypothetical protein
MRERSRSTTQKGRSCVRYSILAIGLWGGDDIPTPSDDLRGAVETKEEIHLNIKSTSADQGTSSKGTWSDKREKDEEEGRETDPSPSEEKE